MIESGVVPPRGHLSEPHDPGAGSLLPLSLPLAAHLIKPWLFEDFTISLIEAGKKKVV